jgi:hypothetical protein
MTCNRDSKCAREAIHFLLATVSNHDSGFFGFQIMVCACYKHKGAELTNDLYDWTYAEVTKDEAEVWEVLNS